MINPNSQIIVYNEDVNFTERKSQLSNDVQSVITYQDILNDVSSSSIYSNGFIVVGPLNGNIVLPNNSNIQYNGPLIIGSTLTVPIGTTLTIV